MLSELENLQRQYLGYKKTSNLWLDTSIFGIRQLILPENSKDTFTRILPDNLRLGKRVEQFVFNELEQDESVSILIENIQIQDKKQTIGELDGVITYNEAPIHLEIVYKFYVYDASVGTSELDHLIGPNRKDNLVKKLTKLKNKQFPLLFKPQTQGLLNDLNLDIESIAQKVCFKAQLFLPFNKQINLTEVNPECVVGYYLQQEDLPKLETCSFYFPTKPNWLQQPHNSVKWLGYHTAQDLFNYIQREKQAACCWVKRTDNTIDKCFVVWW